MVELRKGQAIGVGVRSIGYTGLDQRRGIAGSCQNRNGECLEGHFGKSSILLCTECSEDEPNPAAVPI